MFGTNSSKTSKPWCCLEIAGNTGMGLFVSDIKRDNTEVGDPQPGEVVELTSGERGTLICSHEMGLTPLDLFNDIVTEPSDMKSFLGSDLSRDNDRSSLAIKSYLKFCKLTGHQTWDPDEATNDIDTVVNVKIEPIEDFEEIELIGKDYYFFIYSKIWSIKD